MEEDELMVIADSLNETLKWNENKYFMYEARDLVIKVIKYADKLLSFKQIQSWCFFLPYFNQFQLFEAVLPLVFLIVLELSDTASYT